MAQALQARSAEAASVVILFSVADVLRAQGRLAEALPHYEHAATLQGSLKEDRQGMWGVTLLSLGRAYLERTGPSPSRRWRWTER